jgi:hypothetical protein
MRPTTSEMFYEIARQQGWKISESHEYAIRTHRQLAK